MKHFLIISLFFLSAHAFSQVTVMTDTIKQDTVYIEVKNKEITDVRKGTSQMIVLKNVVQENVKDMTIYLESSLKHMIKWKEIEYKNGEIWIPTILLKDDFYSLYVMKGKEIFATRRLRIK